MLAPPPPTAGLLPDATAICSHINRLSAELRLARRLLRLVFDARGKPQSDQQPATQQPIASAREAAYAAS